MKKPIKNLAASLQGRLRHQADQTGRPYNEMLDYYVMEKFLARPIWPGSLRDDLGGGGA